MEKLINADDFSTSIDKKDIVVALFRVEWCPDCHFIDPFIDDVLEKFKHKLTAFNIDKDNFPLIANKYNVNGIPSFVAFKDGIEIGRFVSRSRKTRDEIEEFFTSL